MTQEEHEMLMLLFARQEKMIQILIELLRSAEIMSADDLAAFRALVSEPHATAELLHHAATAYLEAAKTAEVEIPEGTGEIFLS